VVVTTHSLMGPFQPGYPTLAIHLLDHDVTLARVPIKRGPAGGLSSAPSGGLSRPELKSARPVSEAPRLGFLWAMRGHSPALLV